MTDDGLVSAQVLASCAADERELGPWLSWFLGAWDSTVCSVNEPSRLHVLRTETSGRQVRLRVGVDRRRSPWIARVVDYNVPVETIVVGSIRPTVAQFGLSDTLSIGIRRGGDDGVSGARIDLTCNLGCSSDSSRALHEPVRELIRQLAVNSDVLHAGAYRDCVGYPPLLTNLPTRRLEGELARAGTIFGYDWVQLLPAAVLTRLPKEVVASVGDYAEHALGVPDARHGGALLVTLHEDPVVHDPTAMSRFRSDLLPVLVTTGPPRPGSLSSHLVRRPVGLVDADWYTDGGNSASRTGS